MTAIHRWMPGAVLLLVTALLAGCQAPPPATGGPAVPAPARPVPDAFGICQADLSEVGMDFEPMGDFETPEGCGIQSGVRITRSTLRVNRPFAVTCTFAFALATWEFDVVQPIAEQIFGKEVRRIDHVGSYNCRGIRNRRAQLSEHARGRAIDITGFELTDGTVIRVDRDWADRGPKGRFLREIARGACPIFAVVLTPASDRDHRDHFHMDLGPSKLCSVG